MKNPMNRTLAQETVCQFAVMLAISALIIGAILTLAAAMGVGAFIALECAFK